MRIHTLKLPKGNLGFARPISLELAYQLWLSWGGYQREESE